MFQKYWLWLVLVLALAAFVIETAFCPVTAGAQNPPPPFSMGQPTFDPAYTPGALYAAPSPYFAPPGESFATPSSNTPYSPTLVDRQGTPIEPTLLDKTKAVLLLCLLPIALVLGWTWYIVWYQDALGWRESARLSRMQDEKKSNQVENKPNEKD